MTQYYVTLDSGVISNPGTWTPPWSETAATWYNRYLGAPIHNTNLTTSQININSAVIPDLVGRANDPVYRPWLSTTYEKRADWTGSTDLTANVKQYMYAQNLTDQTNAISLSTFESVGAKVSRPFSLGGTAVTILIERTTDTSAAGDVLPIFNDYQSATVTFPISMYNSGVAATSTAIANINSPPTWTQVTHSTTMIYKHSDGWWRIWWDSDPPIVSFTEGSFNWTSCSAVWTYTGTAGNYYLSFWWRETAASYTNHPTSWYLVSALSSTGGQSVSHTNCIAIMALKNGSDYYPVKTFYIDNV